MSSATVRESYSEIVWRQFKRNRLAYIALWMLLPIVLLAVLAPAVASNQPFVFFDDGRIIYPWFTALFNPPETVDLVFNMALVALPPTMLIALWRDRRHRFVWTTPRRLFAAVTLYMGLTALTVLVVMLPEWLPVAGNGWRLRPHNRYFTRSFPTEQFQSDGTRYGVFPPIPFGPDEDDLDVRFQAPMFRKGDSEWRKANDGFPHVLGTDNAGRDVLVQMIYGTRLSITIGFVAVGIYLSIGCALGAMAGYFGGWVDILISRVIEIILLFPAFFLILTLVAMLGPSIYIIMFVIGITGWPTVARLIRGETLKQRAQEYVIAARSLGLSPARVVFRHILPNSLSPALVAAPFGVASAIITEAGLSLLGFGVRPPAPSWGTLLRLANENPKYWWLVIVPSVAIFVTVTIFNTVGNGLRDAMDPRLRQAR